MERYLYDEAVVLDLDKYPLMLRYLSVDYYGYYTYYYFFSYLVHI